LIDEAMRVRRNPEQDIFQVGEGSHVDQLTALDKRVQECRTAGALEAARE
jgi:hypothetical protein